jgi:hypothetical protein
MAWRPGFTDVRMSAAIRAQRSYGMPSAHGHAEYRMFTDWRRLAGKAVGVNGGEVGPAVEALLTRRAEWPRTTT